MDTFSVEIIGAPEDTPRKTRMHVLPDKGHRVELADGTIMRVKQITHRLSALGSQVVMELEPTDELKTPREHEVPWNVR